MESVKNKDRRKFLACLNPIVKDDYVPVCSASPSPEYDGRRKRKKNKDRKSLSGAMKAVFSKASVKKLQGKKSKQVLTRSNSDVSDKCKESSDQEEIFTTSNSIATSRSTSISSNSGSERMTRGPDYFDLIPKNMKKKQELNIKKDITKHLSAYSPSISGMCIFLVCLLTLVFWGKFCAIMACTTTWLFFAPGARRSSKRVANEGGDSKEDKRRVIMEGFLERTHSRIYS